MSDKVIGGDCKLCGCRNHAPLTCEQWKAQVKNEMRGMYGSAFKARSTWGNITPDKLYEPTALLDAVRAHRDNLMRMLDAAITERDALAAENARLRMRVVEVESALQAVETKLAEYLQRILEGRTLPNRWVGEINDIVQAAQRAAVAKEPTT